MSREALERWMAAVTRGAMADPPAVLTVEDCTAAGLASYGRSYRRSRGGVTFRAYFTPDKRHHAMLVAGPELLLWMDGRSAQVPTGVVGEPQGAALERWLEHRFAMGGMGDPVRALAMWAWTGAAGRVAARDGDRCGRTYPAPPTGVTPAEYGAIGWEFTDERCAYNFLDTAGKGVVRVAFAPGLRRQALTVRAPGWIGAQLWVDGEPVPVPCEPEWGPLCDEHVTWLDDRFLHAEVGGLWSHPLYDPVTMDLLGNIRGMLIWDAAERVRHLLLPAPAEAWTSPILLRRGDSWCVYPDGEAYRADRPDRTLPIPR
ncbi:hypothetical protein [Nonomuraea jabiensis]|uniref:hypothetical protein n=1 Tax=Nonomuraea jabiensis TaxID=882448 RepID=UPI003D74FEFC